MKKLLAFTLAETLIVIGIIGIVSALTLPNLNSSTGEKEKVAKVMKLYQNFNDAYGRAVAVYGPIDEWFANDTTATAQATRFAQRIAEFMKVSRTCSGNTSTCFSSQITVGPLTTNKNAGFYSSNYGFVLADGTGVVITTGSMGLTQCKDTYCGDGYNITDTIQDCILVDIDGPNKGMSAPGLDIFAFEFGLKGIFPAGVASGSVSSSVSSDGLALTRWVIDNGNMDYLKCASSLKWSNQTSCK